MLTRLIMVNTPSYCMFSGKVHEHILYLSWIFVTDYIILFGWLYGTVLCYLGFDSFSWILMLLNPCSSSGCARFLLGNVGAPWCIRWEGFLVEHCCNSHSALCVASRSYNLQNSYSSILWVSYWIACRHQFGPSTGEWRKACIDVAADCGRIGMQFSVTGFDKRWQPRWANSVVPKELTMSARIKVYWILCFIYVFDWEVVWSSRLDGCRLALCSSSQSLNPRSRTKGHLHLAGCSTPASLAESCGGVSSRKQPRPGIKGTTTTTTTQLEERLYSYFVFLITKLID